MSDLKRSTVPTFPKCAENPLRNQAVLDGLYEGVVVLDRGRNIVLVNAAAKLMLGLDDAGTPHELLAGTFSVSGADGHPVSPEEWPSALALRGEFLQRRELVVTRTGSNKSVAVEVSTFPVTDASGNMIEIAVLYYDVMQRREMDLMSRRVVAVESPADAGGGHDSDGRVTSWNPGAERIPEDTCGEIQDATAIPCDAPSVDAWPPPIEKETLPPECYAGKGTILLVDDEPGLLELAGIHLMEAGYSVLSAKSGHEAVKLAAKNPGIQILITDVIMQGGMNGAELAERILEKMPHVKVIYTSGFSAGTLAGRKMSLARDPVLQKPYRRADLLTLVRQVLSADRNRGFEAS